MNSSLSRSWMVLGCFLVLFGGYVVAPAAHANGGHTHDSGMDTQTRDTAAAGGTYRIGLQTHPPSERIVPDSTPAEILVSVRQNGQPARNVKLSYRLYAPPSTFWFSTDFPLVEGTQLLSGSTLVPGGTHRMKMVLPIRGTYRLKTEVEGPAGTVRKTFRIPVPENSGEMVNFAIFAGILLALGLAGGFVIGSPTGSTRADAWLLWAFAAGGCLLLTPLVSTPVLAHGEGSYDPAHLEDRIGVRGQTDRYDLGLDMFPGSPEVGEMMNVRVHASPKATGSSPLFRAEAHFIHAEGGKEMVMQETIFRGESRFDVQLFDGAPHYVLTRLFLPRSTPSGTIPIEELPEGSSPSDSPWEWAGELRLPEGRLTVTFEQSEDPFMRWILLPDTMASMVETANVRMKTDCVAREETELVPSRPRCYHLVLKPEGTEFSLDVEETGTYFLFTQHLPEEFNMTLQSPDGMTMEPRRSFHPTKGEIVGEIVRNVNVQALQPPVDDVVKSMVTLLAVVVVGFVVGYRGRRWFS